MAGQYDWRFENSINAGPYLNLDEDKEFKYSQWRTNSSLSNHNDTIMDANMMNMSAIVTDKMHYDYLFHKVKKKRRFGKKQTEEDKRKAALIKSEMEDIQLIQSIYKYNVMRAREVYKILTKEQLKELRKKQEKGGIK